MPPKKQKEAPLTPELERQLTLLTDKSSDGSSCDGAPSVDDWKALGNQCFAHGSHLTAIKCYTRAIDLLPSSAAASVSAVLYSNRSAAYLKSTMFSGPAMALKDAEKAVDLDANWHKGHLRVADAQYARKKYDEAKEAYGRVLALDPTCQAAKSSLHELNKEMFLRELDRQEHERKKAEAADGEDLYGTHNSSSNGNTVRGTGASFASTNTTATFHNAPLDGSDKDPTGRNRPPTEDETAMLIRTWGQDTCVREDRTAMKPRAVDLSKTERGAGFSYKDNLLQNFRKKVESSDGLSETLRTRHEQVQLAGDGIDYRRGDDYRKQYARSTNGIGLGITADAYKDYTMQDRKW